MANKQLSNAKRVKNDEFYTRMEDINAELVHYENHFKGKTILMNCDDPTWSNFWRYFHIEFERLGLKKIIATHYEYEEIPSYKMEYTGGNDEDFEYGEKTELIQNGDFRSPECIELLKKADIVVTNPPFSLFREYVSTLIQYNKSFIIMGNKNAITYKEFFPFLKNNQVWVGYTSLNGGRWMIMPEWIGVQSEKAKTDSDGKTILNVAGVCWFTNLDHKKRHKKIETSYLYSKKENLYPELYQEYNNYNAINVDKISEIPMDYEGVMGVPITFMDKYNPEQFEIIGISKSPLGNNLRTKVFGKQIQHNPNGKTQIVTKANDGAIIKVDNPPTDKPYYEIDGEYYIAVYPRILIRRK